MENYTKEEFEKEAKRIIKFLTIGKNQNENPKAVLLGGQPGAGKTKLEELVNIKENFISVNGDEFRKYHPRHEQLNKIYGREASKYTQKWAGQMVEKVVAHLKENKYDVIIEGTLRTAELPIKEAKSFKENGYNVELNVVAVKPEKSYLGTVKRYEMMIKMNDIPRMTPKEHHDMVVDKIVSNLDEIYKENVFDNIKIYDREANLLYDKNKNPQKSPAETLDKEFKRKWEKEEYKEYKKEFESVLNMMKERQAPENEIKNIEKIKDDILQKAKKNIKKSKIKKNEKDYER